MSAQRALDHAPRRSRRGEGEQALYAVLVGVVAVVVAAVAWLMEHGSYNSFAAILVGVGIVFISVPLLRRAAALEADPRIARFLWVAFGIKLLSALPRYAVAFDLYDGKADAGLYHQAGALLARQFRDGNFAIELGRPVQGTGFIQIVTGAVYTITGATDVGGFLVFSWFSFWGLYLFHRAFVRACPNGDHYRYALLVFLLPSLLFWPSSIGKEAWMCMGLGVCAYGCARILTGSRGGLLVFSAGLLALGMVRPHVGALVAAALFAAYLCRPSRRSSTGLGLVAKVMGLVVLAGVLVVVVGQLETFLGVDAFDQESVELTLQEVTAQTGQGGSYVHQAGTDLSPARFPEAFVNVVFRPFPWQAKNAQSLLASGEALVLLVLFVTSWRRLVTAVLSIFSTPYIVLCGVYSALFVYGFSSFANFGILVRQRVQVLPFLLVLICLPAHRREKPPTVTEQSTRSEAASTW
jgi:hypothetical protein